jgi:hypothetical protein
MKWMTKWIQEKRLLGPRGETENVVILYKYDAA